MSFFDKLLILGLLIIFSVVAIIFLYQEADNYTNRCVAKGGTVVDTTNSRICIKAERIDL
jgi:hypothetical protein